MYKSFTAEQYKKTLGLAPDYKVDGALCYGTSFKDETIATLKECLVEIGVKAKLTPLEHRYVQSINELNVGDKKIWFEVGYGGALLSEFLHLACLFGSKKNILLGSCGGLKPGMKPGDFIIPTSSYALESSARMYNREDPIQYSDNQLSESLKSKLVIDDNKIWQGPMVTCQAILGQTAEDVQQWSSDDYFGVEMEASTVFAVSNHFKIPSAACVYVSDNLIENHTVLSDNYAEQAEMRQKRKHHQICAALQELLSK